MFELPNGPSVSSTALTLNFLRKVGLIVGASLGTVVVAALALGQFNGVGIANLLFWAALIGLGVGALARFSERGTGTGLSTAQRSMIGHDANLRTLLAKRERGDRGGYGSLLFGTVGIIIFLFSLLTGTIFAAR